jgi:hypothetical protein
MNYRKYLVHHTDDCHNGPSLNVIWMGHEDFEDDRFTNNICSMDDLEPEENIIDMKSNDNYRVYCYCADEDIVFLKEFESFDAADRYCRNQFVLLNEEYPFVKTGMTGGYHPTGHRPEFELDPSIKLHSVVKNGCDHMIIVNNDHDIAYSMDITSVW